MKYLFIIILVIIVGAIGWWLISPAFINTEVQDELDPELAALIEAQQAARGAAQADTDARRKNPPTTSGTPELIETNGGAAVSAPAETAEPAVFIDGPFPIIDTPGHPASGEIEIIRSPEETLVRYANYDGTNGPDLKVYLATDLEATNFINLGEAKGNQGNIIYGVPLDVDLDEYRYVMTWCEAFGVLFDYAEIN